MLQALDLVDGPDAEGLVATVLGSRHQARLDATVDVLGHAGVVWIDGGRLVGLATYTEAGAEAELAAIAVVPERRGEGIGGALLDAVVQEVRDLGPRRLWLVTTNDNLAALAMYQRRGFRLVELRTGAVDRARASNPHIPLLGSSGIPMRDELVLERTLT
jgi:ribosomal protein S18 acetylase RimI-like enzyme